MKPAVRMGLVGHIHGRSETIGVVRFTATKSIFDERRRNLTRSPA